MAEWTHRSPQGRLCPSPATPPKSRVLLCVSLQATCRQGPSGTQFLLLQKGGVVTGLPHSFIHSFIHYLIFHLLIHYLIHPLSHRLIIYYLIIHS